ncbi:urease accessory protein UreD [Nonomuraea zeae]|uniref:Urease accessory protein UreD n=1 Tax=Nonomuraea zeae TaxID=1642303 RepID=A0A5S4GEE1_9ACTN|nr:urease accessory protein UreD [Nonomuraea zeae]TMR31219.1 urease accessory protein UreD [Nonomuraea zeae]
MDLAEIGERVDDSPDPLSPARYTAEWLPSQIARYASAVDMLPVGSPGKVGVLDLAFERIGGRTELTAHYQKAPLHITRTLYGDPGRPDMPSVMFLSSSGGVVQGDRYRIDVTCGAGSSVHLSTPAATRVYRMEQDYASQLVNFSVGRGAYLEYLPGHTIPYVNSRYYQRIGVTVDPEATVVLGETVMGGRLARGELHAYDAYCSDLEVRGTDGQLICCDPMRLAPPERPVTGPAVLAGFGVVASLYVVTGARPAQELAGAMHDALTGTGLRAGAGVLPGERGAWARILGDRSPEVTAAMHLTWDVVRRLLIGVPAPERRV